MTMHEKDGSERQSNRRFLTGIPTWDATDPEVSFSHETNTKTKETKASARNGPGVGIKDQETSRSLGKGRNQSPESSATGAVYSRGAFNAHNLTSEV